MTDLDAQPQLAICQLVLVDGHWMPLALNTRTTSKHRSSPTGPVITAQFIADVEGRRIVNWRAPSFGVYDVNKDGSLDFDLGELAALLDLQHSDKPPQEAKVIVMDRFLSERRRNEKQGAISERLRTAAYDRAVVQINDRLHGVKTVGVTLVPA